MQLPHALVTLALFTTPVLAQEAHADWTFRSALSNANARFGQSIDIDGDRAVIGSPFRQAKTFGSGAGYIFERAPNGNWIEVVALVPAASTFMSLAGTTVALDGDCAALASPTSGGFVTIFERATSGAWSETAHLLPPVTPCAAFGRAIDIEGDRMVVASTQAAWSQPGYVAVYERSSGGPWQLVSIVNPVTTSIQLDSIDLEGDRFVVGASKSAPSASGSVIVFERNLTNTWDQVATITASIPQPSSGLGTSVDLEGDLLVAGAPFDELSPSTTPPGTVSVFERQVGGTWVEVQSLQASPAANADGFGRSVALDAGRLLAGSPYSNAAAILGGAAHVFDRAMSGAFVHTIALFREEPTSFDGMGMDVALDGDRALVSAAGHLSATSIGYTEALDLGSLYHNDVGLSLYEGGTHALYLRGPQSVAGDLYIVLGSLSGTSPGIALAPGVELPLVFDAYTNLGLSLATPVVGAFGVVDANSRATATFVLPAGTSSSFFGIELHHAFVVIDPLTFEVFASDAARVVTK